MTNLLYFIRQYDYHIYFLLYNAGNISDRAYFWFYLFARFGIVFFFLSFIYLVIKKKIPAFLCSLLALGVAGIVDFAVYVFWQRPMPFITHHLYIRPVTEVLYTDPTSFPSSHTYIAFAIATSLFLYGHKKLGVALFALAVLIGIGRIGVGINYPTDILGGVILGVAAGIFVYHCFCRIEPKDIDYNAK